MTTSHNFPYPGFPSSAVHISPQIQPPLETRPPVVSFHPLPNEGGRPRSKREQDVVSKFSMELTKLVPKQLSTKTKLEHFAKLDSVICDLVSLREIKEVCTVPIIPEEVISSISWSHPGSQHFALAFNTKIRLYDYKDTLESAAISQYMCCPFEEVKADSQVLALAFQISHLNYCLATGEKDGTVSLWRYEKGSGLPGKLMRETVEKMHSTCWTLCWVPGSTVMAYGGQDCIIRVRECITKSVIHRLRAEASVNALLSMSQHLLVAGTSSNSIPVYDMRTTSMSGYLKRDVHGVCALSSIKGCEYEVLSASKDSTLSLWDLRVFKQVCEYRDTKTRTSS